MLPDIVIQTFLLQVFAYRRCTFVLPDNGITNWSSRLTIPNHRSFALIGDANGGDGRQIYFVFTDYFFQNAQLRRKYFICIVLYPPRLRKYLSELLLRDSLDLSVFVKEYSP